MSMGGEIMEEYYEAHIVTPLRKEKQDLIEFLERLESTTTDKSTALDIRMKLIELKVWK
jgi:hypothetical protein